MIVIPSDSRPFLECRLYADGTLLAVLGDVWLRGCRPLLSTNRRQILVMPPRSWRLLQTIYVMFRRGMTSFCAFDGRGAGKRQIGRIRRARHNVTGASVSLSAPRLIRLRFLRLRSA